MNGEDVLRQGKSGNKFIFRIIMAVLLITALAPMMSVAVPFNESDNASIILSDIWEDAQGAGEVDPLATAPSFAEVVPSDVTEAASDTTSLYQNAVNQATKLVGTGYLWGGKGFDYQTMKYTEAETIASGYTYYDPVTGTSKAGPGVDCSGLVIWSFNKAYGATKLKDS